MERESCAGGSPRVDPVAGRREETEEERKIEAFIRAKGVTVCPGMGTKELAEHNLKRELEWLALSPREKRLAYRCVRRKQSRPAQLSPQEKQERQRERAKEWYAANREKKADYDRERRERKKQG